MDARRPALRVTRVVLITHPFNRRARPTMPMRTPPPSSGPDWFSISAPFSITKLNSS